MDAMGAVHPPACSGCQVGYPARHEAEQSDANVRETRLRLLLARAFLAKLSSWRMHACCGTFLAPTPLSE